MIFETGQVIADGRYRIESFIAHGGMAEVWRVTHTPTGDIHALKILTRKSLRYPDLVTRFDLEYEVVQRMDHPHIVKVYDKGSYRDKDIDLPWFTMNFYPSNLRQRLPQISIGEGLSLLLPILDALQYSHDRNICHRDLKPMNILIDSMGRSVLTDYGIAKETDRDRNLTGRNIIGTAYYISPEQCMGLKVTPRSDIYAFGVILYQLCTGHFPFEDTSEVNIIRRHISEAPRRVHELNPAVSSDLAQAIEKCLKKKPEERYQSCTELAQSLRKCEELNETAHRVLKPGQVILNGKYKVITLIEQGGFAEVYRIKEIATRKQYALKMCLPALAYDNDTIRRFKREITIMKALSHPHIVSVREEGEYPYDSLKLPYFVMPFYPGNLGSSLSQPTDPEKALNIIMDVLEALAHAHTFEGAGVLHRDLKPSNILIDGHGRGYLTDFGIAKISKSTSSIMTRSATMTRAAVGTSYYMAPEQIKNQEVDGRADIYSIGIILYEIVTGRKPFEAGSSEQIIAMHLYEKPTRPSEYNENIPPRLETIIMRCLDKERGARHASVRELIKDLNASKERERWFGPESKTFVTRMRRPMRSFSTHARQWASSAMPLVTLGGIVVGLGIGVGGKVGAHMAQGGSMPGLGDAISPSKLSYVATVEPARRLNQVVQVVEEDLRGGQQAQVAAWTDPPLLAFLPAAEKPFYETLKQAHEAALAGQDYRLAALTRGRMEGLLSGTGPRLEVDEQVSTKIVQTNQGTGDATFKLNVHDAGDAQMEYAWQLVNAATNETVKNGTTAEQLIRVAQIQEGEYQFKVAGMFQGTAISEATFPIRIVQVVKPINLEVAGSGASREVRFANFDPAMFRSYTWKIVNAATGETEAAPESSQNAPLKVADLTRDGVYQISVLALDASEAITDAFVSNPQTVEVDRTAPTVTASAMQGSENLGTVAAGKKYVMLPGDEELRLTLSGEDTLVSRERLTFVDGQGRGATSPVVLRWNEGAPETTRQFHAVDPAGNRSEQPLTVTVRSVSREMAADLEEWAKLQRDLAAEPEKFVRTRKLVSTPAALQTAIDGRNQLSRAWLEQHIDSAEVMGELKSHADTLRGAMNADQDFAARLATLQNFAAGLDARVLATANEKIAQAKATWENDLNPELRPDRLIAQTAQTIIPQIPEEAIRVVEEGRMWSVQMAQDAAGVPGAKYRMRILPERPADDGLQTALSQGTVASSINEVISDPTKPIYLVLQTVVEPDASMQAIGGREIVGAPQLIYFNAPVELAPNLTQAIEKFAQGVTKARARRNNYLQTNAWLEQGYGRDMVDRSGRPAMDWLIDNRNDATLMQQLQDNATKIEQFLAQDEKWNGAFAAAASRTSAWTERHRDALRTRYETVWKAAKATDNPDVAGLIAEYQAANASGLLQPPTADERSVVFSNNTVTLTRSAFGRAAEEARLAFGWRKDKTTETPRAIEVRFNDEGKATAALPTAGEPWLLAARWTTGNAANPITSEWVTRGPFTAAAVATPTPAPTPSPTPSPEPTATPRPTAAPASGEITDAEALQVAEKMSAAVKSASADAMISNYSALFGSGGADSAFLSPFLSGSNAATIKYEYQKSYRYLGAARPSRIQGNVFQITIVSQNLNSGQQTHIPLRVTLGRSGGNVIIVKDEKTN